MVDTTKKSQMQSQANLCLYTNKPDTLTPFSVSEDSVAQIAASLVTEQKEKGKRQMNVIILIELCVGEIKGKSVLYCS